MPRNQAKPAKLVIRLSVGVNDSDYGSELQYTTTRYVIDKDNPLIPVSDAEHDVRKMLRAAFDTIAVERAYAAAIAAQPEVDSPAVSGSTIQELKTSDSP